MPPGTAELPRLARLTPVLSARHKTLMNTTANRSYRWLFWTLALCGLILDQGSKYGLFAGLYRDGQEVGEITVIPNVFYLETTYSRKEDDGQVFLSPLRQANGPKLPNVNHGALWGIGGPSQEEPDSKGYNHIFAVVSIIAAIAIVFWSFRQTTAHDRWLCVALGLILAGTLGNLYDRVVFEGVRDFFKWVYLYRFPVFNVADSCLVCGASLLLLQAFFASHDEQKSAATAQAASEEPMAAGVK
jgi:signal peptidase II